MSRPEDKRPGGEDQSPPGHATDEQEHAVAAPASSSNRPSAEVAARTAKAPVRIGGRQGDLDEMFRFATALAGSNLLPDALKGKASDVLVTVLYGQELGLAPMQSCQSIYVVKGKPQLAANLWVALARKAGHRVVKSEHTAETCTVTVYRRDDPETPLSVTYTIDDAKTAGLTSNDNYRKNPKAMLYARASSTAVREACPEVALGFVDEFEMHDAEPAKPSLAEVAANRDKPAPQQRSERPIQDVTDAEIVEESGPSAEDLTALAETYSGGAAETGADLFGEAGWPDVAQPGGGR